MNVNHRIKTSQENFVISRIKRSAQVQQCENRNFRIFRSDQKIIYYAEQSCLGGMVSTVHGLKVAKDRGLTHAPAAAATIAPLTILTERTSLRHVENCCSLHVFLLRFHAENKRVCTLTELVIFVFIQFSVCLWKK